MIKRMKQQMGIVSLMMGIGTVLAGYFAWGLLTVHHKSGAFGEAGFLFFTVDDAFLYAVLLFCPCACRKRFSQAAYGDIRPGRGSLPVAFFKRRRRVVFTGRIWQALSEYSVVCQFCRMLSAFGAVQAVFAG